MVAHHPLYLRLSRLTTLMILGLATAVAMAQEGLHLVADLNPGAGGIYCYGQPVAVGDRFYALIRGQPGTPTGLWRSDGTPAGTTMMATVRNRVIGKLWATDDRLYVLTLNYDGTTSTQDLLTCTNSDSQAQVLASLGHHFVTNPADVAACHGRLFITQTIYDPLSPNTTNQRLIAVDPSGIHTIVSSSIALMTPMTSGERVFFIRYDEEGPALWQVDGASLIPSVVRRFPHHAEVMSYLSLVSATHDRLFFRASVENQSTLWSSDGTPAGTVEIGDYNLSDDAIDFHGQLIFRGNHDEPWISDGTASGTHEIIDLWPGSGPESSYPYPFRGSDQQVFFTAATPDEHDGYRVDLFRTDGTAAGTISVYRYFSDDSQAVNTGILFPAWEDMAVVGRNLYFSEYDPRHGVELWCSDGTSTRTRCISDVNPRNGHFAPRNLTAVGKRLFMIGDDGIHGPELWVHDPGDQAPTLTVNEPIGSRIVDRDGVVHFSGTASDDVGVTQVTVTYRGMVNNVLWITNPSGPDVTTTWDAPSTFPGGDTEVTITAEDAAGNRTSERKLVIVPGPFANESPDVLVGFIEPMITSNRTKELPGGDFAGATVYALALDGTSITSVTYEFLDATSGTGTATLRDDGDWQIPPATLAAGNTTIKVTARTADGRVAHSWLELMTLGASSSPSASNHANGRCGAGSGLAALMLGLACVALRRRW
jgi:ELWxxDGT repeat protein